MNILYDKKFLKDVEGINDKKLKVRIEKILADIENCKSIAEIDNLKKMKGHPFAYRIRTGAYRIGIFAEKDVLKFVRVMHRKEIYRYFP